ncbi:MAG: hypothetical protein K6G26_05335 [Lachnospiraceae bacterium]|nr:hypothetical protein [Lachnospiraceae bacterium]
MKKRGIVIASLALAVILAGTVYGIKSKAALNSDEKDIESYATGLELPTSEDIAWTEENVVKLNDAEDYYDYIENGTDDVDKYIDNEESADKDADFAEDAESEYKFKSAVDNSTSKYFPAIGNQDSIGSCCSWAMVYYQFSYMYNREFDRSSKNSDNLFSPMFVYEQAGPYDSRVANVLLNIGAATLNDVPAYGNYNNGATKGNSFATGEIYKTAAKYRVAEAYRIKTDFAGMQIENNKSQYLDGLKAALNDGEILSFSTDVYMWDTTSDKIKYDSSDSNYDGTTNSKYKNQYIVSTYKKMREDRGGHRMTIVGYDDNIWFDTNKNGIKEDDELGAFKIANSWGNWRNKGFIWLAYHTLSYKNVSGSEEANHAIHSVTGFRIKTIEPKQFIKVDIESESARDIRLSAKAYDDNGNLVFSRQTLKFNGYTQADTFDGKEGSSVGNFYFPMDALFPDINSDSICDLDWQVTLNDVNKNKKPQTIKNLQIIDDNTGATYDKDVKEEYSADGREITYHVATLRKEATNTTTIYYKGFDTPYIHYCVEGKNWTNVPGYMMTEDTSYDGCTHKYVIDLDDASKVYVCFNDGKGNWDSDNGRNYTFEAGTYTYINGQINKYNTSHAKAFDVALSVDSITPVQKGQTVNLSAKSVNGKNAKYRFGYIQNGNKSYFNDYSSKDNYKFTANNADNYTFFVEAEANGKTAIDYVHNFEVKKLYVSGMAYSVGQPQYLGTEIIIEPYVYFADDINGIKTKYEYTATLNGQTTTIKTNDENQGVWVPKKKGIYTITLKVTNGLNDSDDISGTFEILEKDLSLKLDDFEITNTLFDELVVGASSITSLSANGGAMPYTYNFGYINKNGEDVQTYSGNTGSINVMPPYEGDIVFYGEVVDANGDIARKEVKKHAYGCTITGVDTSIASPAKVGDEVTFTINTKYEVNYKNSNYAKFEFINEKTGDVEIEGGLAYASGKTKTHKFTQAGHYKVNVYYNTYGSGLCTYTFGYDVKDENPDDKNSVTIFYKGFNTPYIHYSTDKSPWTNLPGVKMDTCDYYAGYTHVVTIDLQDSAELTACFNDGNGNWDSNNGYNYKFKAGKYTYSNGKIKNIDDVSDDTLTLYYSGYAVPYVHYAINNNWTNVPGVKMEASNEVNGYTHKIVIDMSDADNIVLCFNDGNGNWDSNNGQNYTMGKGTYYYKNGVVTKK